MFLLEWSMLHVVFYTGGKDRMQEERHKAQGTRHKEGPRIKREERAKFNDSRYEVLSVRLRTIRFTIVDCRFSIHDSRKITTAGVCDHRPGLFQLQPRQSLHMRGGGGIALTGDSRKHVKK